MKKVLLSFFVVISILGFLAFGHQTAPPPQGALGDVKYSILPPDQFKRENGDGWEVLNGDNQVLIGSDLQKSYGIQHLPDARGVFIRGLNLRRDSRSGDPDSTRIAGSPQDDAFQGHYHSFNGNAHTADVTDPPGDWLQVSKRVRGLSQTTANFENQNYVKSPKNDGANGEPRTATETRPKNIALYTYVKVNNR